MGEAIKVVHLTSVHGPNDPRIVGKECTTLAHEGYDVVVVAPGEPQSLPGGVRHRAVAAPRNRLQRFFQTIRDVYSAARAERGAIYHFHDPELIGVGIALRCAGARVIFDVHEEIALDICSKPWIPRALRPIVGGLTGLVLRAVQGWFSAIVPATPSIADSFSNRRTVVVRNYPRLESVLSVAAPPLERRPMTALYLGSITLLRGVEQMVRAMADPSLPGDARLLLAGEFETAALRAQMSALPGWQRVDAPGRLNDERMRDALDSSRIGLLTLLPIPSFERSLPTKLFEYMAAGLPVVASKFVAVCQEVIMRYDCGLLVDPRDSAQIAQALRALFCDPQGAAAMGARGRAAVRGRYEWRAEARHLLDLYAEVAR